MRSRNIKPGFFRNDVLAELNPLTRILFAGLWCVADREGRLEDRPKRIKADLLPYDDCDIGAMLDDLADAGFILRYEVDGARYVQVANFSKHQNPHYKELPSEIPSPDGWDDSPYVAFGPPEGIRQAVFDRDGRRCVQCQGTDDLTLDHIVPRSKGGTDDLNNLQTLCRRCNSGKNNRQAKAERATSLADDRPIIGSRSADDSPSNPADSGFLIPDSLIPDTKTAREACADAGEEAADESVSDLPAPVPDDTPHSLYVTLMDVVSRPGASIAPQWERKQHGIAKRLLEQGYGTDKVRRCLVFMRSQAWRTSPMDLGTVEKYIGTWEANGEPERDEPADATRGHHARDTGADDAERRGYSYDEIAAGMAHRS